MPSRNTVKIDLPDSYYHVYARGASRLPIFLEDEDYEYFLSLFQRYLSDEEVKDSAGVPYEKLRDRIELNAYCLMNNHFHLLVYQKEQGAMTRLMRGVMTAYSRYLNKKYGKSGSVFESRYKASRISSDEYLMHISRYIHLNPDGWQTYPYSSLQFYEKKEAVEWVKPGRILDLFSSPQNYKNFVADYKATRDELEAIKHELADY